MRNCFSRTACGLTLTRQISMKHWRNLNAGNGGMVDCRRWRATMGALHRGSIAASAWLAAFRCFSAGSTARGVWIFICNSVPRAFATTLCNLVAGGWGVVSGLSPHCHNFAGSVRRFRIHVIRLPKLVGVVHHFRPRNRRAHRAKVNQAWRKMNLPVQPVQN